MRPRTASPEVATDRTFFEVGRLLGRYHEAVSGFSLPPGVEWHGGAEPGPGDVVCHNDLAPRNTVFRGGSRWTSWASTSPSPPRRPGTLRTSPGSSRQVHAMDAYPFFVDDGDIGAARALVGEAEDGELFLYPGDRHLFADGSLPSYDADAAALLVRWVLWPSSTGSTGFARAKKPHAPNVLEPPSTHSCE